MANPFPSHFCIQAKTWQIFWFGVIKLDMIFKKKNWVKSSKKSLKRYLTLISFSICCFWLWNSTRNCNKKPTIIKVNYILIIMNAKHTTQFLRPGTWSSILLTCLRQTTVGPLHLKSTKQYARDTKTLLYQANIEV